MKHAINYMNGQTTIGWAIGKEYLRKANIHASEFSWAATKFDIILDNNDSIDKLYSQVEKTVHSEHAF